MSLGALARCVWKCWRGIARRSDRRRSTPAIGKLRDAARDPTRDVARDARRARDATRDVARDATLLRCLDSIIAIHITGLESWPPSKVVIARAGAPCFLQSCLQTSTPALVPCVALLVRCGGSAALNGIPCTLNGIPCTLNGIPCTLNGIPCTLNGTPCTAHLMRRNHNTAFLGGHLCVSPDRLLRGLVIAHERRIENVRSGLPRVPRRPVALPAHQVLDYPTRLPPVRQYLAHAVHVWPR